MQLPVNKEQVAFGLLENIQASFALYEVISENYKVIDLRMLWANQLYLDVVKLSLDEAVGMPFSQIAPGDINWIPLYGDVALRKKGTQIVEGYSDYANQFIHVQAYSPAPGQVATILHVRNRFVQFEMEKDLYNLQNILNGLDMMVYVTEINTGKILFVNKRMMDSFKLKRNVIGEYCYKVFREGYDAMCQFCPCFELNKDPEKLIVWEEYISNMQQYIRHSDCYINWPSGEKVHLQYAIDITEQVYTERKMVEKNEFNRIMFDNAPIGFVVFDENFQLIDCNDVVPAILGVTKEYYLNNLSKMEPEYQPDGSKSSEKRHEYMKRVLGGEIIKTEWMHCSPKGEKIPTEVTLIRIKQVGKYIGFAYFYDLREHKRMVEEIEQQNNLLHTVNRVSAIMLQSRAGIFENDLNYSMGIMAKAAKADRVYIWKNATKEGRLYCSQIYEWSEGAESQQNNEIAIEARYDDIVPGWEEQLSDGFCINGIVRDMNEYEKAALQPQGILSILVVPILIKNDFWGFIGFDDCHTERIFSKKEELILRSASQLIANAFIRNEESDKALQAEERIKLMLDATPLCCHLWDGDSRIIDCNEAAVSLYGFSSKQECIERFKDVMPEYQPDGQSSLEKSRMYMKKAIDEGRSVFNWMHQMPDGTPVPSEVTLVRIKYKDNFVVASYTKDLREIKTLEKKAEDVYYDSLTGIHNRRYLDKSLDGLIKSLSQTDGSLSLMMIDIDHFKLYNDTYGHIEGDNCLRIVTEVIKNSITRETDFIARYGGEEFTVVLPHTDEEGARIIAEKFLDNIRNAKIPHSKSDVADYVTISIGVVTGKVNYFQSSSDYIKKADEMLYISKQGGRNKYALTLITSSNT